MKGTLPPATWHFLPGGHRCDFYLVAMTAEGSRATGWPRAGVYTAACVYLYIRLKGGVGLPTASFPVASLDNIHSYCHVCMHGSRTKAIQAYVYICTCIYTCAYGYTYKSTHVYIQTTIPLYTYTSIHPYMYQSRNVDVYSSVHRCMHASSYLVRAHMTRSPHVRNTGGDPVGGSAGIGPSRDAVLKTLPNSPRRDSGWPTPIPTYICKCVHTYLYMCILKLLYAYSCMYEHVRIYLLWLYVYEHINVNMHIIVMTCTCVYIVTYTHNDIHIHVHVYPNVCLCKYFDVYVCTYIL